MDSPKLVPPSTEYKDSYIEALREGFVSGDESPMEEEKIQEIDNTFENYVQNKTIFVPGPIVAPDGNTYQKAPDKHYWLVTDTEFIGSANLRLELTPFLRKFGGHIGYGIRPKFKKQGYGKTILKLCLEKAKEHGINKVLVTCKETNIGSKKIIEANGGRFEKTIKHSWRKHPDLLYWIDL